MISLRYTLGNGHQLHGIADFETVTRPDGLIVAIITEPTENPGPSVTNAAENIATNLSLEGWRWDFYIEHYTDRLNFQTNQREHSWDFCVFEWHLHPGAVLHFAKPTWRPSSDSDFQQLISSDWMPPIDCRQIWPPGHSPHQTKRS